MDETEEAYVDFLKSRDIVGIPSEVVDKFIVILKQKDAEIQDEKIENEKLRVFNEQQNFALEKELQETVKQLNEVQLKKQQDESKLVDFELRVSESTGSLVDLKTKNSDLTSQLENLKTLKDDLTAEKNNLFQIVERCNTKIDELNAEVRALTQKLSDTHRAKCEAMLKLDDALGNEAVCQSKVRHLEQEKDRFAKIVDNLNNELTQATQTIFSARTEQSHKILDLQAKLNNLEDQGRIDRDAKETLQSALEERDKKIDNLISQLKDQRDLNIQSESQFSHELRSQVKLANLYKASLDESQGRVKDVLTAGEEMQSLLKQSVDDNKLLKETNERQKQEFDANILELTEKITKLENELVNANDLLSQCRKQVFDVDTLSPAAAAASNLLKSGKSLTEIYTEYIDLSNELEEEKATNSKLNLYLEQILKEVEEKAPYFHKQRENLEKSLETIDILSQELQKLKTEKEYLETCNLENTRKGKVLLAELEVSEKSKSDLGRQVSHLLKEIEILKGRRINESDDEMVNSADLSQADSIISENLLYFKDVVELQVQNQKLLTVLRDLSENRQEEENEVYEKKMTELKGELESALEQIAELRDARSKQDEVVTSIARQRDMYRLMATPNSKPENDSELESSSIRSNITTPLKQPITADNEANNLLMVHLQEELSTYKSETKQQIQNLNEQIEKFKEEKIEIHLQNSKISSQLQFSDDRYKNLSSTIEGYKKEIKALSARNEILSSMSAKHEEMSCSLKDNVMALQEKLSRSESELINIRREKSLIQQSEAHLKGEIETLKQERSGQAALLINLQTIQRSFEAQDNEWRTLLKNRITALEKEVSNLQSKLDLENARGREAVVAWEKARQDLSQAINEQAIKLNQTKEDLDRANALINDLKIEKVTLETTLKNRDGQLDASTIITGDLTPKRGTSENDDSLNLQLLEARSTINSLREQLKRVNDHLINLKAMSSSLEGELAEQNKVSKIFKEEAERMLRSKESAIANLEQELNLKKMENDTLVKEKNDIITKTSLENAEIQANLNNATNELNNLKFVAENLKKSEEDAKEEIENQRKLLEEIRSNYEKEVAEHTSVLSKLEELQLKYEEIDSKYKIAEDSAQKADYLLEVANSTWQDKETTLNEERKRMSTEIEELHSQNQNLLELLDRLKAQVMVFQNRKDQGDVPNVELSKEHSEEHMFDVIKYLRKEKELAVAKSEVVVAENSRLTTKIEFLEKRLQETNKMLQESQAKEQISVTSAVQHAELLRKVELLNVLTDGNRVLRAEKTEMQKQLKDLEVKAAELEKELTLIRSSQLTLVAQRDSLQVERKALESESRRWQLRAQHLVEQSSKMTAEEHKKSLQERENFEKQLSTLKEELTRVRASLSLSENSLTTAQKDLELLRSSSDVAAKDTQISDLNNSLQQVRKIARKYKVQFDELKLQNDKLKSENEQMITQASKVPETEAISQVNVAEAVELAKQELKKEFEVKIKEAEDNVKSSDEKVKKIRQTAVQRIATLTTSKDEQQREFEEWKSKYSQLETAKNDESLRLINMNTELESCSVILKNDLAAVRANLNTSIKEKSALQKEIDELNSKLSMQQKQLESLQKQLKDALKMPTASLSRDSSILAQSSSDVVNPPTANIKPMATPSSSVVRHPHPSSGSSSRLTPMGRIRPITAVSPASSRTVAVPPTSASSSSIAHSQQDSPDDGHPTPSTGVSSTSNVPQATVAPTQAVLKHAVVASVQQIPIAHQSSSLSEDIVSATNIGLNAAESFGSEGFEVELGESSSVSADNEMQKKNRDVESSSTDGLSSTTDSMKRSRDDAEIDSSSEALVERSPRKRPRKEDSRTADSFQSHSSASESIIQHRGTVAQVQATTSQAVITPSIEDSNNDDVNEVIVLESDDESVASEGKRNDLESGAVDEDDDEVDYAEDDEEMDEDEEFQEEGGPDVEEEEQSREEQYPDDNEIVIIDDPESVTRSNEGEQPGEASESIVVPSQNRRYGYRFPIRSERLPSVGRTVPCSSIGPPTGCEDGDSIVPSTPTLFDSRRNDGFSEAISSPQVPSETFLFGNSEQPSQLASQALAMDDTRMDLTQFDDATGRSVPSTPLQVSPLDALATEIISDMLPDTSNASSSSHPQHLDQTTPIVPKITVTGLDENTFTIDEDVQEIIEEGDNQAFEEPTATTSNEEISAADDATEIITLDTSKEEPNQNEADNDKTADNSELDGAGSSSQANDGNQQSQEQQAQRRTTPIVWDEPVSSRRGNVALRGSPPTRASPGRGFARRSRPIARPTGPTRGGAFPYYRDAVDPTSQNRLGNARGPRMGGPPGRGRHFARRGR